jgi:hypothetical protein
LNEWNTLDKGCLVLNLIASGQHGGLWFKSPESGDQFIVVLGVHNFKEWLDIAGISGDEVFESVVD